MNYLFDTNMVVLYSRDITLASQIEAQYNFFSLENTIAISVITLGEIDALIKKLGLGHSRQDKIFSLLDNFLKLGIHTKQIIERYGDIDAYSQGKLSLSSKFSAKNMGKNDLWIAATASAYDLTLVTTDKDFNHLNDSYIQLVEINPALFKQP